LLLLFTIAREPLYAAARALQEEKNAGKYKPVILVLDTRIQINDNFHNLDSSVGALE
jgi:hypothetical protein